MVTSQVTRLWLCVGFLFARNISAFRRRRHGSTESEIRCRYGLRLSAIRFKSHIGRMTLPNAVWLSRDLR